jgi:hypothetical protein
VAIVSLGGGNGEWRCPKAEIPIVDVSRNLVNAGTVLNIDIHENHVGNVGIVCSCPDSHSENPIGKVYCTTANPRPCCVQRHCPLRKKQTIRNAL